MKGGKCWFKPPNAWRQLLQILAANIFCPINIFLFQAKQISQIIFGTEIKQFLRIRISDGD
jgi:hypothetical protein